MVVTVPSELLEAPPMQVCPWSLQVSGEGQSESTLHTALHVPVSMGGGKEVSQVVLGAQAGRETATVCFTQSRLAGQSALLVHTAIFS